jgi:cytochrome c peroxidase
MRNAASILILLAVACHDLPLPAPPAPTPYELTSPSAFPPMNIPAENPTTQEGVALGRKLFYDPILSGDNSQACADCHRQENAFSDPRALSVGIDGTVGKRNSMSLANIGWQRRTFWDGRVFGLEAQALHPIQDPTEMHESLENAVAELRAHTEYPDLFRRAFGLVEIDSNLIARALAQFERTLISANSRYDRWEKGLDTLSESELRGMEVFLDKTRGGCTFCHSFGGIFSDFIFRNNGLDSLPTDAGRFAVTGLAQDFGAFKTTSLRNIALTAPYMHDGRFATLEEVVDFYDRGFRLGPHTDPAMFGLVKGRLKAADREGLVAFLKALSDDEFIQNPIFGKPQ